LFILNHPAAILPDETRTKSVPSKTTYCIIVFNPASAKKIAINTIHTHQCCVLSARTFEWVYVRYASLARDSAAATLVQAGEHALRV